MIPTQRALSFAGAFVAAMPFASAQVWQSAATFPAGATPRELAVGVNQNGVLWIVGGTPADAGGNSPVHKLQSGAITTAGASLEGAFLHLGAAVDGLGRLIVFGGEDAAGDPGESYEWNELDGNAGGIAARSSQAPTILFAVATDDQGRVYSLGGGPGAGASAGNPNSGRVERYDAATDTWQVLAAMPTPVADAGACFDGQGHVLVIAGFGATGARTANVARYDIASGTWSDTAVPDLPVALSGVRAVRGIDGRIYAIGGSNGTTQRSTWVLDASHGAWTPGPDLSTPRQRFACVLGNDDFIYAFGGSNDTGGTGASEKLLTFRCPRVDAQTTTASGFVDGPLGMSVTVSGAAPMTFRWRRDGVDLVDGLQPSGSVIAGATTAGLGVLEATLADVATYDCVISNSCGATTSAPITVTLATAPSWPASFGVRELHPAAAISSLAYAVDGDVIGGTAKIPGSQWGPLDHPYTWSLQGAASDITPSNSVGGVIYAMRGGAKVGWWWWPYTNQYGTGYYQHGAIWAANGAFFNAQPSGYEIGSLYNTDGVHHVGSAVWDEISTTSSPTYWPSNTSYYFAPPTPSGATSSSASATAGGKIYGSVYESYYAGSYAAMWTPGPGASWQLTNLEPVGATTSYLSDAHAGQQIGRATIGGSTQAGVWAGSSGSFTSLNPIGSTSCEASATRYGLQVGMASFADGAHAFAWRGNAASGIDLDAFAPAGFGNTYATDLDLDAFGTVTISGWGWHVAHARNEALIWRGNPSALTADVAQLSAASGGTVRFTLFGGAQHAGKPWTLVVSPSGAAPGMGRIRRANGSFGWVTSTSPSAFPQAPVFPPSNGTLDETSFASAQLTLPAGALNPLSPLKLQCRFFVSEPNGALALASNVVALTITP